MSIQAMTDRELLELAARAAGMEYPHGQTYCETLGVWGMLEKRPYHWWNPLTDDGDALRLAVKLKIGLSKISRGGWEALEYLSDRNLATDTCVRRAIVRAAAEIGKEMK